MPLPLDLGFNHSNPALYEGLWVARWRRLVLGVGRGWIGISPSPLNSLKAIKISYAHVRFQVNLSPFPFLLVLFWFTVIACVMDFVRSLSVITPHG